MPASYDADGPMDRPLPALRQFTTVQEAFVDVSSYSIGWSWGAGTMVSQHAVARQQRPAGVPLTVSLTYGSSGKGQGDEIDGAAAQLRQPRTGAAVTDAQNFVSVLCAARHVAVAAHSGSESSSQIRLSSGQGSGGDDNAFDDVDDVEASRQPLAYAGRWHNTQQHWRISPR